MEFDIIKTEYQNECCYRCIDCFPRGTQMLRLRIELECGKVEDWQICRNCVRKLDDMFGD